MRSLFSTPAPCAALGIEQPLLETPVTQKRLATFIVVANRAHLWIALDQTTPLM
jgi:hypothetical protein